MMEWENKLYQILLPGREALGVMEDWLECNIETDIRLRRAKTKGHLVMEEQKKTCCICGKELEGYGYNPFPVKEEGICCRSCNYSVVIPERWKRHKAYQRGEEIENKRVYISGAIAHYDMAERKEAFGRAEELLRTEGYDPVNPFNNGLPEEAHWKAHMRADIALLLACDYIYMLKDWELSKGAKLELDVASSCGIKVLFE